MSVLLSWHRQFKNDPSMSLVSGLYQACGGGRKSEGQLKSEAAEKWKKEEERRDREKQVRMDRKTAEKIQKEEEKERERRKKKGGAGRVRFDFVQVSSTRRRRERARWRVLWFQVFVISFHFLALAFLSPTQEKPKILTTLSTSQQLSVSLCNALQHINRQVESIETNPRVQDYLEKLKVERKRLVRYIQLVQDEEFLGGLISANEQVLLALELYDKLARERAENDSDDDEPLANITGNENGKQKYLNDDKEIEIVRKRIADARLGNQFTNDPSDVGGELEKLQIKQRTRLERHNSYLSSRSSLQGTSGVGTARGGGGAMDDLMDLNFDDNGSE